MPFKKVARLFKKVVGAVCGLIVGMLLGGVGAEIVGIVRGDVGAQIPRLPYVQVASSIVGVLGGVVGWVVAGSEDSGFGSHGGYRSRSGRYGGRSGRF